MVNDKVSLITNIPNQPCTLSNPSNLILTHSSQYIYFLVCVCGTCHQNLIVNTIYSNFIKSRKIITVYYSFLEMPRLLQIFFYITTANGSPLLKKKKKKKVIEHKNII